ncbi:hypothetical protein SLS58_009754 [Diplodia intermedia]|uniref:Uncharacterized protein n=1 Tax=Diplodia intermedia TaxID=856260 RepID=A0ABR3TBK5_9PEZI
MDCRSPSPPLHFPDIRSTPSPLRRRLPRPLPEPPIRLPKVGTWTTSYSSPPSASSSRACSTCSDGSESVLAIINEIDDALHYTNSTSRRRRQKPPHSPMAPARTLRRKFSPRNESLREIRARDSEICLQRVYEREVMMYLDGSIFSVRRPLQDDDDDDDDDDDGGGGWGSYPP